MLIKFRCQHCQTILQATSNLAGKNGSCPKCNKAVTVPNNDSGSQKEQRKKSKIL